VTLPISDSYAILVDPTPPGDITLTLYDVPPDVQGSLTVNGSALTVTTTAPGQQAYLTFPGTSGQSVTLRASNNSVGCFYLISLVGGADGWSWAPVCGTSFTLGPVTLSSTATYTIRLRPDQANFGNIDVQVTSP
jgi:hypothetical protein